MIDALDAQIAPLDKELRAYARRQAGLQGADGPLRDRGADRGHDPRRARRLHAVLLLARTPSATPGWTSPCTSPISAARPGTSPAKDRRRCAGRCSRPPSRAPAAQLPDRAYYRAGRRAARRQPRVPVGRAQAAQAQLPHAARARRGGARSPHDLPRCAPSPSSHRCAAAGSRHAPAATPAWTAQKDRAAATLPPAGSIAVGTAVAGSPPRRSQRARLTHWALPLGSGVEAHAGPGVQDAREG